MDSAREKTKLSIVLNSCAYQVRKTAVCCFQRRRVAMATIPWRVRWHVLVALRVMSALTAAWSLCSAQMATSLTTSASSAITAARATIAQI